MDENVIVISPHPDDETLGCGGTILRHRSQGHQIHWLNITHILPEYGFLTPVITKRENEIKKVVSAYGFSSFHNLALPTMKLETLSASECIQKIGDIFTSIQPSIVYLPHHGDAHSDHRVVHNWVLACTKWFRYISIRRVLSYEVSSETHMAPGIANAFNPNVYIDITKYIDKKIEILSNYKGEMGKFPFPRSEQAIRSLASFRGSLAGFSAAESFMLLYERI